MMSQLEKFDESEISNMDMATLYNYNALWLQLLHFSRFDRSEISDTSN